MLVGKVFTLLDTGSSIALLKAVYGACGYYPYFLRVVGSVSP